MCSTKNNSPTRQRPKRTVTRKPPPELLVPTRPRRRPKTRKKPKYLSLKLELSVHQETKEEEEEEAVEPPLIAWMPPRACKNKKKKKRDPLLLGEDRPDKGGNNNCTDQQQLHVAEEHHHVALLFETATDGTSTALDGLLDSSTSDDRDPLSPSLSCVYSYGIRDYKGRCGNDGLLRSAIRCKERETSVEERWVSYNEVVEAGALKREQRDQDDEDASSNCVTGTSRSSITEEDNNGNDVDAWAKVQQLVGLKLDKYQDILDAWSDKPPFCFPPGEDPQGDHCLSLAQIVPDLQLPGLIDIQGSAENVWRVPDVEQDEKSKDKDQGWKTEQREASVLRYKEKRQNRLFSKRIRYEVRKVNAEKRPRLKGRFVKRNE